MAENISDRVAAFCGGDIAIYNYLHIQQQEILLAEMMRSGKAPDREAIERAWEQVLKNEEIRERREKQRANCVLF